MTNALQPVTSQHRIESLDVLRGFAIIGVLFALFLQGNLVDITDEKLTRADNIIRKLASIFLHGKAYNLLAFLFGYGFAVQVRQANQKGVDTLSFALRRALGLFILGTLHAVFLRDGDILAPYAICSLFMILLRNSSNKKLITAIMIAMVSKAIYFLIMKWVGLAPVPWQEIHTEGMGLIEKNITHLLGNWYPHFVEIHSDTLVLFLIGMYASRRQWLEKMKINPRYLNMLIIAGVILGICQFFIPWRQWYIFPSSGDFYTILFTDLFKSIVLYPFGWGINLVYIGIFLRLLRMSKPKLLLGSLANMGKMSLTNYLSQDIFWIPLFLIFNLWGKFSPTQQVVMATAFALLQICFSGWWLKRSRFGPFEWLLRSFTYWKWQPMKKKEKIQQAAIAV